MYAGLAAGAVALSPLVAVTLFLGSGAADVHVPLPVCHAGPVGDDASAPPSAGGCAPGADPASADASCSVRPDPTTGRGCLTQRTAALALELAERGWAISCWDEHAWNPSSDHPQGRACDVFPGQPGRRPSPTEQARGDALAAALQATSTATGVDYLIWSGRIWSRRQANSGWRPYSGGGVYDPTDVVGGHHDHIHISVTR